MVLSPASSPSSAAPPPDPPHPALWRAHQVARARDAVQPSGFAPLDAELPGGGWPSRALTELLLPHPGVGEVRLLAPALAAVQHAGRPLMLFDPPALPCAWTLAALGLDLAQLVVVRPRAQPGRAGVPAQPGRAGPGRSLAQALGPAAELLWALEHALKSGHVGAVLAWLPGTLRPEALRRLQLAAQAHDGPAFLLRDGARRGADRPSAAPLRLALAPAGPDELELRILKRRGPPLARALRLELPPVLSAPARARALRGPAMVPSAAATPAHRPAVHA